MLKLKLATALALFLVALLAAGLFGALHDQVSFTVSPEYFTKFKFIQFGLLDPSVGQRLRVAWIGFQASWYMGIPLGLLVVRLAFIRRLPPAGMWRLGLRSFALVLAITAAFALGGLAYGYFATATVHIGDYSQWYVPADIVQIRRYLCAGYMHNAAYRGGAWGTIGFALFHYLARKFKSPAPLSI